MCVYISTYYVYIYVYYIYIIIYIYNIYICILYILYIIYNIYIYILCILITMQYYMIICTWMLGHQMFQEDWASWFKGLVVHHLRNAYKWGDHNVVPSFVSLLNHVEPCSSTLQPLWSRRTMTVDVGRSWTLRLKTFVHYISDGSKSSWPGSLGPFWKTFACPSL